MRKLIWAIIFAVFLSSTPGLLLAAPQSQACSRRHKPKKLKMKVGKAGKIKMKKYKRHRNHRRH